MTTEYAKIRIAFGKPIGSYQGVKHKAADMLVDVENAKSLTYYAAWAVDENVPEASLAASMAKAYGAKVAQDVTTRALTLLGDEALEPGHPVEKWYRDAKIYDIFEGTGQIQRRIISRSLLGVNPT